MPLLPINEMAEAVMLQGTRTKCFRRKSIHHVTHTPPLLNTIRDNMVTRTMIDNNASKSIVSTRLPTRQRRRAHALYTVRCLHVSLWGPTICFFWFTNSRMAPNNSLLMTTPQLAHTRPHKK